jgi:hypothetical protein
MRLPGRFHRKLNDDGNVGWIWRYKVETRVPVIRSCDGRAEHHKDERRKDGRQHTQRLVAFFILQRPTGRAKVHGKPVVQNRILS